MASADDLSIRATDRGDGPPVVFLHGAWLSGEAWAPQVDRFAEDYRVVTVDARGHGSSADSNRSRYSVDLFASDLRRVIETLDLSPPVLCGLSLGGLIARAYARDHPVRGVVLAGTVRSMPPVPMTGWQKRTLFPKASIYPTLRWLGAGGAFRLLLRSVEASLGRPWLATTRDAREYALGEVDRVETGEFVKTFDALYDYKPPDIAGFDVPALVVHGDHEAPPVKAQNRSLARDLGADRVSIDDAGHLANMDNPDAFDAAVGAFLDSLDA